MEEFDALVAEANGLGLKVGPLSQRGDVWRAYLQRGPDIFRCAEGPTITAALAETLFEVKKQLGIVKPAPKPEAIDDLLA